MANDFSQNIQNLITIRQNTPVVILQPYLPQRNILFLLSDLLPLLLLVVGDKVIIFSPAPLPSPGVTLKAAPAALSPLLGVFIFTILGGAGWIAPPPAPI